ncbi:ribbon-helix-helix protein [Paracoccus versutus]|uniref:Plasmid segregation centromere-binding protein ParG n=1 Tax=Paracoccus versutus TaxID=34007 RepID=A0A3D9XIQ6_PARVE|nr:hypothetical protein [Paracoccus versutus]REF66739.1 plasmid segregation centromere-binding protein ParG [Paracoccus versutus]WGR54724.1 hypothetical protein E3U25_01115 [Paracoccus versutus]
MTGRTDKRGFAARPTDPDGWIKAGDTSAAREGAAPANTARLTIDVTPAMRGRIKVAAFNRGITVADMLRELLAREFPDTSGDRP